MRRIARFGAVVAVVGGALAMFAPSAGSASTTFTDNGTFVVPAEVCQVTIAAWGGAGADGDGGIGGAGGRIRVSAAVTAGDTLAVFVGKQSGAGYDPGGSGAMDGGNGGGSSAVELNGTPLIVAGGGGGGGDGIGNDGGAGGVAASALDFGAGGDGTGPGAGTGGAAGGTRSSGGNATGFGGGGGAGAAPGTGSNNDVGGGGGGGNTIGGSASAQSVANPGTIATPNGQVTIDVEPGVGCVPQVRFTG